MKDLLEKYYNMIYYCTYKILFYFLYRLIGIQSLKIKNLLIIAFNPNGLFFLPLWIAIGLFMYYINKCFLFKNDKYRKYFKQFDKEKKYVQYYGIYVFSIIIQITTYYVLIKSLW